MVKESIIIGQNTPIKDLEATPVFHKGERVNSYFETKENTF